MQIFNSGVTDYDILLGAAGVTPPPPPPTQPLSLRLLFVRKPSDPASRRVLYKATRPRQPQVLRRANRRGSHAQVKLDSVTQCFSMLPAAGRGSVEPTRTPTRAAPTARKGAQF